MDPDSCVEASSVLGEQSESPDVTEKLREDGCPESGELVQFGRAPLGILGCGFSSFGLGSDSIGSTSSTEPKTCRMAKVSAMRYVQINLKMIELFENTPECYNLSHFGNRHCSVSRSCCSFGMTEKSTTIN